MMNGSKVFSLTNLLLVVSICLAAAFIYVTYGTYRNFSFEQEKMQAFYIADRGINQAILYLSNAPGSGGYGPNWRVKDQKEFFSVGAYTISVEDGRSPGEIVITSIGETRKVKMMLQAVVVYGRSLPDVFNYALYSGSQLELSKGSMISGSIYVNDDLTVADCGSFQNGSVFVSPGYTAVCEDDPSFKSSSPKRPYPFLPVLDTTEYYNKISAAKTMDNDVRQGDMELANVDLNGKTILVNGNVTIKGNIIGKGSIVSARNMSLVGGGTIDDGVFLVCDGKLRIEGKHRVKGSSYFYSKQKLMLDSGAELLGGAVVLSPTVIDIGGRASVSGLVYAPTINIGAGSKINGSITAQNYSGIPADAAKPGVLEGITVRYDQSLLPLSVLGFNVGNKVIMMKPGSVKEI
jgi:hypothetical protein